MNYQLRKKISPQKTEEAQPGDSTNSPTKFQRTSHRAIKSPEETNVTSVITESVLTQSRNVEELSERPRVISRTNRVTRELVKSPLT